MSDNHWIHIASHAMHSESKTGAVALIVIGFFFAPLLIGIPIMIIGFVKLFK